MTIDQMIQILNETDLTIKAELGVKYLPHINEAIIEALKVGQALNNKAKEAIKELENGYETCGLLIDMKYLVKVWDAATKEGV